MLHRALGRCRHRPLHRFGGRQLRQRPGLWSSIKTELDYWPGRVFTTRAEAESALFRYIDGWYNPRRIQEGLGGMSPDEFEDAYDTPDGSSDIDTVDPSPTRAR